MNFFKRYLFKKALLEDDLANDDRRRKEVVIQKQPEPVSVIEPQEEVIVEPAESPEFVESSDFVESPEFVESPSDIGGNFLNLSVKFDFLTSFSDLEIANFELSEEEQARLLSDYEQEIKEREKSKTEIAKSSIAANKSAIKSKNQPKPTSNVQSSKGKNTKSVKFQQQQKSTQQPPAAKGSEKTKKTAEGLKVESNHFKKDVDSSSTSDESWEKEFDL